MILDNIENVLTLFATIIGLLGCLFKYIKANRRGYLYLIIFFLASFLSEYYWTVYTLVMNADPEVSEFLAYLGWNIAYVFLLIAVLHMRKDGAKRFFHPAILWPVVTNVVQFFLYIQFGGLFNNLWQVGVSTLIMVFCMQDIAYYLKNKKTGAKIPHLSILVLLFMIAGYGMWTSSCFDWPTPFLDPYPYCSILRAVLLVFFAWGAEKDYGIKEAHISDASWEEFRFRMLLQGVVSVVICSASVGGYILAVKIRGSMLNTGRETAASNSIMTSLFVLSAVLVLFIMLLIFEINRHYRTESGRQRALFAKKNTRFSFVFTVSVTFVLMLFSVIYNSIVLYRASVAGSYEDGKDVVVSTATDLENYLTVAKTTLRVVAETVDAMKANGGSTEDILEYLTDQTNRQFSQFDENFTGIYAYIDGVYLDGSGWVPPEGYDPTSRDWYRTAVEAEGNVVIVSPYLDAQTGGVVITVAKMIRGGEAGKTQNMVCLDVIVNHIQEVTEQVSIVGKGYGMVVNTDGFIVAHRDRALVGQSLSDVYDPELLSRILSTDDEQLDVRLHDEACTLFVHSIMDQWIAVIVIGERELLEDVYSQLTVNILVSFAIFWLISYFYYFGYKIEQHNSQKVEALNMQVVSALAEAIDAKDTYTNGHSSRVAKYARMIAARAGYSEPEQNEIYMMGLLHDVGKIGIPDQVINKKGKLTAEEYEIIKSHPVIGSRILESIKERPKLATGARWHHERYGGGGYPDSIVGEEIPDEARIIAVADAYDAMTSQRSYRDMLPQAKARSEIEKGSGTQFDPRFAKIMIELIDEDTTFSLREK